MQYIPQTTNTIDQILTNFFNHLNNQIDQQSLLMQLPSFTCGQIFSIISEINQIAVMPSPKQRMFKEEYVGDVPKLQKDTLMPKDLSQEKGRVQSPGGRNSPKSSVSSMRKIAFKKRQSSNFVQKLHSAQIPDKKPQKIHKKQQKTPLHLLNQPQPPTEQPTIQFLREKAQSRLQQTQQYQKFQNLRQNIFQSKLNELNSLIQQNPKALITYNYQGDALRSNTPEHENIKIVMTKTGIGFASKKIKEGVKILTPEQSKIQVRGRISKSFKDQISLGIIKPQELPLFPMKFIEENQVKNLKLQEYKKFYGKKYNRIDNRNHTIDMNKTTKTINKQQNFIEKKCIKDNKDNQEEKGGNYGRTKSTFRKLALPKLNGKYKVLDRYEE